MSEPSWGKGFYAEGAEGSDGGKNAGDRAAVSDALARSFASDPMSDPERKVTPMNVEHLFSDRATVNGTDLHVYKSGNRMVVRVDVDIQRGDPLFHEGVEYVVLDTRFHHGHDGVPAHLTLDVEGVRP